MSGRAAARIYAVIVIITGLGIIGGLAFLDYVFRGQGRPIWFEPFALALVAASIILVVLGVFVWRQHLWAMVAGILLSACLAVLLFDPTAYALVLLALAPVLLVLLTVAFIRDQKRVTPP